MTRGLTKKLLDPAWIRKEFWRLFKYGIVGVLTFGIFIGIYALLSRILWTTGNKTLLDGIALTVSAVINFTLHRIWTFEAGSYSAGMITRYVISVIGSTILQTALFHLGNGVLGFNDFAVQVSLVPIIAAISYVINRQFTFNSRFEKTGAIGAPNPSAPAEAAVPVEEESG